MSTAKNIYLESKSLSTSNRLLNSFKNHNLTKKITTATNSCKENFTIGLKAASEIIREGIKILKNETNTKDVLNNDTENIINNKENDYNRQITGTDESVTYHSNIVIGEKIIPSKGKTAEFLSHSNDKSDGQETILVTKTSTNDIGNSNRETYNKQNNNNKFRYHSSSVNYYWPLDPSHNLYPAEFLEEINKRKLQYDP
jgi:hypothetical protein